MGVRLRETLSRQIGQLRYEPTAKRVRAEVAGVPVVDSERALLIWEPRRVVPTYAVPAEDVLAEVVPAASGGERAPGVRDGFALPDVTSLPVLDPRIPFAMRLTEGQPVEVRVSAGDRTLSGFLADDPDLAGYVILDFAGADRWLEEEEEITGHPRDPFHRVDVRASSRSVQLSLDGRVLADSSRPRLVFETMLATRYYLPREDVSAELRPSETRTWCPYKGGATYWSVAVGERVVPDLVWSYEKPLPDAAELEGYLSFFDERMDVVVDGVPRPRPVTPWS
jgi:uncharacterized protein (DUF427 family)